MQELTSEQIKEIEILKSDDSQQKREIAEKYLSDFMNDEIAEAMAANLLNDDIGVRDAVSQALIYNENARIPYLIVPYTTSKQEISTRNLAGEILLKRGINSLEAMTDHIDIGDDDDKKFLIDLMGLIGDKSPSIKIRKVLLENQNDNVILACIEAVGNIKSEDAVEDIVKIYDKNELFKPTIIEALGNIGSDEAVNFILSRYHSEDVLTRFSMIESIGLIGNEQAFFLLLSELPNLSGPLTHAAILSLNMLKDKLGLDIPFDESMKNSLLSTLLEGEIKHKKAAAELITAFQDKEIIGASLKIYGLDEEIDYKLKEKFFESTSYLYTKLIELLKLNPANSNKLLDLLKEVITADGGESISQLSVLEMRTLCDVFTTFLEHTDEEVRRNSIELLFYLGMDTALMFIDTMANDDNYWNKLRVVEILESIDDERATEGLRLFSEDPEEMVRERALEALSQR